MATITLAKALKYRKELKKELISLHYTQNLELNYKKDDEKKIIAAFKGKAGDNPKTLFQDYLDKVVLLNVALSALNQAIDEANLKANKSGDSVRGLLNHIEHYKNDLQIYQNLAKTLASYIPVQKEWDPRAFNEKTNELGDYVEVHYETLLDENFDYSEKANNLKKCIKECEDLIDDLNHTIIIDTSKYDPLDKAFEML